MILADKITKERKKNGWSQEELANQLGVSRQAVSKWESAGAVPDLQRIFLFHDNCRCHIPFSVKFLSALVFFAIVIFLLLSRIGTSHFIPENFLIFIYQPPYLVAR